MLQGAGSAFAFTGAVYLAAHGFSAGRLATAIGATQSLGMLGGWAGQFVVGPVIQHGTGWQTVWHVLGGAISAQLTCFIFGIASGAAMIPLHHHQGSESGRGQGKRHRRAIGLSALPRETGRARHPSTRPAMGGPT